MQRAGEPDRERVLQIVKEVVRPGQRVFVGVVDPIDPRVETQEEVRDRVIEAAGILGPERLGTCDDCGFSPFGDDTSTSRDTAYAKISARGRGHSPRRRGAPNLWRLTPIPIAVTVRSPACSASCQPLFRVTLPSRPRR
jgi:Cobalamin-independent synthase, Catalytic domain